jgi:hypothetical protein
VLILIEAKYIRKHSYGDHFVMDPEKQDGFRSFNGQVQKHRTWFDNSPGRLYPGDPLGAEQQFWKRFTVIPCTILLLNYRKELIGKPSEPSWKIVRSGSKHEDQGFKRQVLERGPEEKP